MELTSEKMRALLIVDVQNDFCTGGILAAKGGEKVAQVINKIAPGFDLVIASKDWHPEKTAHFDKWPVHCVQNTKGAEFHSDLQAENIDLVVLKGTGAIDDGYSAFEATNVHLTEFLREKKITELYVTGIATDYCVKASAIDAAKNGFETYVVEDAVRGVNVQETDSEKALQQMRKAGCKIITSTTI